jgi:hypothetical protein
MPQAQALTVSAHSTGGRPKGSSGLKRRALRRYLTSAASRDPQAGGPLPVTPLAPLRFFPELGPNIAKPNVAQPSGATATACARNAARD